MLGTSIAWISIVNEPKIESENPSSFSCLEMMGEEDRKELGYLKGDFRDELDCRKNLKSLFDKIENIPDEKMRQALIEAGIIED